MKHLFRKLAIPAVGVVIATAGFGYMAQNQVNPQFTGEGSATVSGYSIYSQNFETCGQLDEAGAVPAGYTTSSFVGNPTNDPNADKICDVSFFAVPANWAGETNGINETGAQIQPSSNSNWYTCTTKNGAVSPTSSGVLWSCDTSAHPFANGAQLTSVDYEVTGQSFASNQDANAQQTP
jgi:hypothetical protein